MENKYTYSIIIPHKNIPKLLQRCLDSIPERDDVEVIVVDDNSDPVIVDFNHFPGTDRPNTTVIFDKSGKGAGRARNIGIQYASGDWLLFADCDDYYFTDTLSELMDTHFNNECQAIYWGTEEKYPDGSKLTLLSDPDTTIRQIPNMNFVLHSFAPWKKMIRRTVILENGIFFDEIPASNDVMFQMRLMGTLTEKDIYWFPKVVYTWEKRDNSITTAIGIEKATSRFVTSLRANRYSMQRGWGMADATLLYLTHLKKLSKWRFYYSFYLEWWYLGLDLAIKHYRTVCSMDNEHLLLHTNPFMIIGTIKSKTGIRGLS